MDIDSGEIFKNDEESLGELNELRDSIVEISNEDMTDEEYRDKKVNLKSNTKLAKYARDMINIRRFVQFGLNKKRK